MNPFYLTYALTCLAITLVITVSEASDYGRYTRHFWSCTETGVINGLADVVGNAGLPADSNRIFGPGDTYTVRASSWGAASMSIPFYDSGDKDTLIYVVGKARKDAEHPDPNNGGNISFYYGNNTSLSIKVQPYYAVFSDNSLGEGYYNTTLQTPFYSANQYRNEGQVYALGGLKRGGVLEHYADGVKTGSVAVLTRPLLVNAWYNFRPTSNMLFSHSGWGPQATCDELAIMVGLCELPGQPVTSGFPEGVSNYAQDYYGFAVFVFENGAPAEAEINDAMIWMKAEWQKGNKEIYPLWKNPDAIADGDLAPLGNPDSSIDIADYLVALRIVTGRTVAGPIELAHGDIYPAGAPDGNIDMSDVLLLLRQIQGAP